MVRVKKILIITIILFLILLLFRYLILGKDKLYYIPEVGLYVKLENKFGQYFDVYLSKNKNFLSKDKDCLKVLKKSNTELILNLMQKDKVYIVWNSYRVPCIHQNDFTLIGCDQNDNIKFYTNYRNSTEPQILRNNFIEISICQSLDGVSVKKANETYFTEIKEIDNK